MMTLSLLSGCPEDGDDGIDDTRIWHPDSVSIDFTLSGPVGQTLCELSITREELNEDQLDGLYSLMLHDASVRAGCDVPNYRITVHAEDGSSASYRATRPECSADPILLFEDFDAWARSTSCSQPSP